MDEQILNEILTSYRDAINALIERIDAQDEMVKAMMEKTSTVEKLIYDEVLNPAKEAMEKSIYDSGLEDFTNKYGEKLQGYNEKLRPIEGEDFDIMKEAYDGYNEYQPEDGEKPDADEYVDELVKVVDNQLENIRSALGLSEDAQVAVVNEDGETKVEVDGEEVDVEDESTEIKSEGEEGEAEKAEEAEKTEEEITEDDEAESDPDDLAALEEELLKYKN